MNSNNSATSRRNQPVPEREPPGRAFTAPRVGSGVERVASSAAPSNPVLVDEACEELLELEYIDGLPLRSGRPATAPAPTPAHPLGSEACPSSEKTWIWALPGPQRGAADAARRPEAAGVRPRERVVAALRSEPAEWSSLGRLVRELRESSAAPRGVSILATVGVGSAASPRVCNGAPLRAVNEPTQIFKVSPEPSAIRDARPSRGGSAPLPMRAEPPFAAVPSKRSRSPSAAGDPLFLSSPAPRRKPGEARRLARTFAAPLLRAFDHGRARAATWSTAQTSVAPVSRGGKSDGGANAQPATLLPQTLSGQTQSPQTQSPQTQPPQTQPPQTQSPQTLHTPSGQTQPSQTLVAGSRRTSVAMKRRAALIVATLAVVGSGSFAIWRSAERVAPAVATAAASAPEPTAASSGSRASVEAPTEPPNLPLTRASHAPSEAIAAESSPSPATAREVASSKPSKPSPSSQPSPSSKPPEPPAQSVSSGLTLARQAVDALLAGDRPKALSLYRELARTEPDRGVYREAVQLLTPSASDAPPSLTASDE